MSNAAEYLLQFFEVEQQPDGFRKDVLSAYTAMCSTERTLDTLIARGVKRLDMAKITDARYLESLVGIILGGRERISYELQHVGRCNR